MKFLTLLIENFNIENSVDDGLQDYRGEGDGDGEGGVDALKSDGYTTFIVNRKKLFITKIFASKIFDTTLFVTSDLHNFVALISY